MRSTGESDRRSRTWFETAGTPVSDQEDHAHVGFVSFLGLIDLHKPSLWLHGHVHLYGPEVQRVASRGKTKVVNVFGHSILEV